MRKLEEESKRFTDILFIGGGIIIIILIILNAIFDFGWKL